LSETLAECVCEPLVPLLAPVIVNVGVPRLEVDTVKVAALEPAIDDWEKVPLAPLGNPLTLSDTLSVKPPTDVTVMV
jgi:hypothetical protein